MTLEGKARKALMRGGDYYDLEDIKEAVLDGSMQGFVEGDSWVVTKVLQFPKRKIVHIILAVGFMRDMTIIYDELINFAKSVDADAVTANGRSGWIKKADAAGWIITGVHYMKDL